ncbi:CdaR family protein [Facklamia lactis]|uniref:CdaR family protein n=1 Tax=Facklamia lactis TaxID=2749967 RepID=UPI0018CD6B22|nr:CdaR family protein [Facklamia lactis]MBG9980786.1 hypothetical protein [Facklamia lactis]
MNRVWENKWAVRLISLLFALVIYSFVTSENYARHAALNSQTATSVNSTETIEGIPLYLGEHPDDIYVSDIQETVSVKLEGPRNILNQVTRDSFIVQTEEVSEDDLGAATLSLEIEGLPNEVSYRINPSKVSVSVEQREVVEMPVEYTIDELQVNSDYRVDSITVEPENVKLVGSKAAIDMIDFVGINISSEELVSEPFTKTYRLQILDKEGKLLDVNTDTMDIAAEVEIIQNSKEVPLEITAIGEDNSRASYSYSFANHEQVVLYGSQEVLKSIEAVEVVVDVSQLQKSSKVTGMLNLPSGISSANINQVEINIEMEPTKAKLSQENSEENNSDETDNR